MTTVHPTSYSSTLHLASSVFNPPSESTPESNLEAFIRLAKEELTAFGDNLDWPHWWWPGAGYFLHVKGKGKIGITEGMHLSPAFVDFAKAYIRYQESHRPSTSSTRIRLSGLRVLDRTMLQKHTQTDPTAINLITFDLAAQIAQENYSKTLAYMIGRSLESLARFLSKHRLTHNDTGSWRNPIKEPRRKGIQLGAAADAHRLAKLPSMSAINAIGTEFAAGFVPSDHTNHPDLYLTSVVAMLLSASNRAGEIHELMNDLELEQKDSYGDLQYGWRYRSFKNQRQSVRIKWIPKVWVPIAREAVQRIREITEEPRAFARYVEEQLNFRNKDSNVPLRFYRHINCPNVPDDQPLTAEQAAMALGFVGNLKRASGHLGKKKLSGRSGFYTLDTLWEWVLNNPPPGFPYVMGSKNKQLKYSDALFCMHRNQLKKGQAANPVSLWLPSLHTLSGMLGGDKRGYVMSFFERHGARGESGEFLSMTSHQARHLIDTLAHTGTGETFLGTEAINFWAGREKSWQGTTYNHQPSEETARRVEKALKSKDGNSYGVFEFPRIPARNDTQGVVHWTATLPSPKSCADIDMNHRSAVLFTIYGGCEHDWLLEPCQFHKDCLNCKDHFCIRSAGKDDQERLQRIKELLPKVITQQQLTKAGMERGEPGARYWNEYQTLYRERIEQLVAVLESPDVPQGSKIRLANPKANSHLHRVLRETALRELANKSEQKDVIKALLLAFQSNRPFQLTEVIVTNSEKLERA